MKPPSLPQRALNMAREHGISVDEALFVLACQDAIENPSSDEPAPNARVWTPRKPAGPMTGPGRCSP